MYTALTLESYDPADTHTASIWQALGEKSHCGLSVFRSSSKLNTIKKEKKEIHSEMLLGSGGDQVPDQGQSTTYVARRAYNWVPEEPELRQPGSPRP